jgi:metal-responsive CopG/Arc/MetJ family transcriptional regulator
VPGSGSPVELMGQVDRLAEARGLRRSDVIRDALAA